MHRRDLLKLSGLLGLSAVSGSVSRALAAGVSGKSAAATPAFTAAQRQTVTLLSDMIIPPTDTPGAVAAGVPAFIELIYTDWYHDTERAIFIQGLTDLDQFCIEREQQTFNDASESTRIEALTAQEKIAAEYQSPVSGGLSFVQTDDENAPFFKKIKELVVLGYYTSEVGAQQELAYLPMPGYYDGNYDFNKIGRQWTY